MLPKNLRYMNKIESASANAYTSNIAPVNGMGPYSAGQTIMINIPTSPNICLIGSESTLKFNLTVTNNSGGASQFARLDRCGASGIIQRLRLYSGSALLEDVDNYSLLYANLVSLQKSNGSVKGKFNISNGTRIEDMVVSNSVVTVTTAQAAANAGTGTPTNVVSCGQSYICPGGEKLVSVDEHTVIANTASTISRTYSISLLSILGSLGSQYVPLFAMHSSPLRVELQLVDSANKFICSDVVYNAFAVSNVEYVGSFLELSDSSMQIINSSLGGQPLQYVIPSFRNYVYTVALPNASSQINAPIACKFSSLKSIFAVMRDNSQVNNATFFPMGSAHYGLTSYTLRIGSKVVPAKAPASTSEYFVEACKAITSVSDINHCPTMNMYSYNRTVNVANTETAVMMSASSISGNFLCGIDVETYANANKDEIFSGLNTTTSDVFWQFQYSNAAGGIANLRYDFYSLYDSLLVCENNTAYVKF